MSGFTLRLKTIRKVTGMTQREVAERARVSLGTYRTWEQGTSGMSLESAYTVSNVLGCTPNDLCDWYATHPREALKPEHKALIANYERCTPERRVAMQQQAQDAALASMELPERAHAVAGT